MKMLDKIVNGKFSKNITDKERAAFELGIKLGALFHISIGIPISNRGEVIETIEHALENSILCQPYVTSVHVRILNRESIGNKQHEFDYSGINPKNLYAEISLNYKSVNIKGKLEWNDEINYPLMYIDEIS